MFPEMQLLLLLLVYLILVEVLILTDQFVVKALVW